MSIRIIDSARKHGLSDEEIFYAYSHQFGSFVLRDNPPKTMILGFDSRQRPIEIGIVGNDATDRVIIHAMKAANATIKRFTTELRQRGMR